MSTPGNPDFRSRLRARAEELITKPHSEFRDLDPGEVQKILHELDVYRVELEIQNEELRQAQLELGASRDRLNALFQLAPVGYVVLDQNGRIMQANRTWLSMVGRKDDDLRGTPFGDLLTEDSAAVFRARYRSFFRNPSDKQIEVKVRQQPSQEPGTREFFYASIQAQPGGARFETDPDGQGSELLVTIHDISSRKELELEREITIDLLKLLTEPNHLHDLIRKVTLLMQNWSGCTAVAVRLEDGDDYPYFETRGFPPEFVSMERCLCVLDEDGEPLRDERGKPLLVCMCGNVIQGRFDPNLPFFTSMGSFWTNSTTELLAKTSPGDRQGHTRNRCNAAGYESVALIPLVHGDDRLGLIQFNDYERDRFSPELISLLERLATNIAIALRQRRDEGAVRTSEENLKTLFHAIDESVCLFDLDGRILAANETFAARLGRTVDQCIGSEIWGLGPPDLSSNRRRVVGELVRTGKPQVFEDERDGRWMVHHLWPVRDPEGKVARLVVYASDVTERKRGEAERARLMAAIEQSGETVLITDRQGVIQYVNSCFERVTGFCREEAIGKTPKDLASGYHSDEFYRQIRLTVMAGRTWQGRVVSRRRDGSSYTEHAVVSPVVSNEGEITNFVIVTRDITQDLLLEEQYTQSQKLESIGRLAGGVAHDLNNLLAPILGYGEMLLEDSAPDDPSRESFEEIVSAGERARDLVAQLLTFGRKQRPEFATIALNEVLSTFRKLLRRTIREDISIAMELAPSLPPIRADRGQLEQVVMNLAVNAQDAMPEGGRLTIRTAAARFEATPAAEIGRVQPGEYVVLEVSDTGHGMDAETREHIFEPFYTTKGPAGGTGLGLATVYGIVKQHSGTILVESNPGAGTTCRIYLPTAVDTPEAEPASAARSATGPEGSETILLVEDNASVRNLARRILVRRGYSALEAANGRDAHEIFTTHDEPIDLLLTDVVMPEMNGKQLYDQIAAASPGIQVLFMSGYSDDVTALRGVRNSPNFLQKPFSVEDLAARVRSILDQRD